jgi:hypothetical protein
MRVGATGASRSGCRPQRRWNVFFPYRSTSAVGRWLPVAQKNANDCFPSDPVADARSRRLPIELAASGPQAATEFSWLAVDRRPKRAGRDIPKRSIRVKLSDRPTLGFPCYLANGSVWNV